MLCSCSGHSRFAAPVNPDSPFAAQISADDLERDAAEYPGPGPGQTWIDAHAHPGRCFLVGLPSDAPFVQLMGAADTDTAFDELEAGHLGVTTFATVGDMRVLGLTEQGIGAVRLFAPGEAAADHQRQLRALDEITHGANCRIVKNSDDLSARNEDELGVLIACEGGDFLEGEIGGVQEVFDQGARSIGLVDYRTNELGDIQTEASVHKGLTSFGREVVGEMNRLGMVIDLAHATWEVTRDTLEISTAPVMISHSHLASGDTAHPRLLSLEHARAVARSGGVVAAWPAGVALASFDDYIDEILRMVDALGIDAVAIGTDMDANYRPVVGSYRQFPRIAYELGERGLAREEVAQVMGDNLQRLYARVLPKPA